MALPGLTQVKTKQKAFVDVHQVFCSSSGTGKCREQGSERETVRKEQQEDVFCPEARELSNSWSGVHLQAQVATAL